MAGRVIRSEINSSDSLSQVSIGADLTFRALLVATDDFGRIDGRVLALKASLFPLRAEATPAKIQNWVGELCALEDPPVVLYMVGGRPYIQLTGWEKHRGKTNRAKSSVFPDPPETQPRATREIPGDSGRLPLGVGVGVGVGVGDREAKAKPTLCLCPDHLTNEEFGRVVEHLIKTGTSPAVAEAKAVFAIATVRDWSLTNNNRRTLWDRVVKTAITNGWALNGWDAKLRAESEKRSLIDLSTPDPAPQLLPMIGGVIDDDGL